MDVVVQPEIFDSKLMGDLQTKWGFKSQLMPETGSREHLKELSSNIGGLL
jgi:hypothetical protein